MASIEIRDNDRLRTELQVRLNERHNWAKDNVPYPIRSLEQQVQIDVSSHVCLKGITDYLISFIPQHKLGAYAAPIHWYCQICIDVL